MLNPNDLLQLLGGEGGYRRINEGIGINRSVVGLNFFSWYFDADCPYNWCKITLQDDGTYKMRLMDLVNLSGKSFIKKDIGKDHLSAEFWSQVKEKTKE